jgi:hypothetical protein
MVSMEILSAGPLSINTLAHTGALRDRLHHQLQS